MLMARKNASVKIIKNEVGYRADTVYKNEVGCRGDTVQKNVDTRKPCEVGLRASNNLP